MARRTFTQETFVAVSPATVRDFMVPYFRGLARELAQNSVQHENSAYARNFQQENAHLQLTAERLSAWVQDVEAFQRSDFEAMLHYYKQNYPHPPYEEEMGPLVRVQAPVLQFHGLQDRFLLPGALNGTWEWLENDWTLVTIPHAGHFVQHDAAELVTKTIVNWLAR
jgi:epoxide hydrolase 4